jgi:hypothetical protein
MNDYCPYCSAGLGERHTVTVQEAWDDDQLGMIGKLIEDYTCGCVLVDGKIEGYCLKVFHEIQDAAEALSAVSREVAITEEAYLDARVKQRDLRAKYEIAIGDSQEDDPWVLTGPACDDNYRMSLLRSFYPQVIADGTLDHQS